MLRVRPKLNFIQESYRKIHQGLAQIYSPKDLRSLLIFIGLGLLSLLYQLLSSPVKHEPQFLQDAQYLAMERHRDSLFAVLSRRKDIQDSFHFYAPDTAEVRRTTRYSGVSKLAGLSSASISLNASSRADLMKLPSVGEATATLILEYRKQRGRFRTLAEIMNVRGIGPKKFERMKPFLRLD